jgi:hypothetical protein
MKEIILNFNSLTILAIIGDDIFLQGHMHDTESEEDRCVARIERKIFEESWQEYLEEKKRSCEGFNEACGSAFVRATKLKSIGMWHVLNEDYPFEEENSNNTPMYLNVQAYSVGQIDVEVEHG